MSTDVIEFPRLKEAREDLATHQKKLATILEEAGDNYDMAKVKSIDGDNTAKVATIRELHTALEEKGKTVTELLDVARAANAAKAHEHALAFEEGAPTDGDGEHGTKTRRGEHFIDALMASNAVKGFKANVGPTATLDNVEFKTLFETSAGWAPETTRTGRVEMFATRPDQLVVNYIPQTTTGQQAVVYMEETTFTNPAVETAEGGAYLEATLELEEKSSPVRKIPVFLAVTDEQFEDEPRSRAYVQNRLPFMVRQRLDGQILTGDGTGVNLRGTENIVGIQTQALGSDNVPNGLYKVMRKIQEDGFADPSVVFIRPSAWEVVATAQSADGQWLWGHPSIPGPKTIWGVPVVLTTAVTATKAVVGDYTNFSELAVRRGVDVQISNSHSDYFVKGQLALRADIRVALVHYRPKAFGTLTGL